VRANQAFKVTFDPDLGFPGPGFWFFFGFIWFSRAVFGFFFVAWFFLSRAAAAGGPAGQAFAG
jgi:hypothetical protein